MTLLNTDQIDNAKNILQSLIIEEQEVTQINSVVPVIEKKESRQQETESLVEKIDLAIDNPRETQVESILDSQPDEPDLTDQQELSSHTATDAIQPSEEIVQPEQNYPDGEPAEIVIPNQEEMPEQERITQLKIQQEYLKKEKPIQVTEVVEVNLPLEMKAAPLSVETNPADTGAAQPDPQEPNSSTIALEEVDVNEIDPESTFIAMEQKFVREIVDEMKAKNDSYFNELIEIFRQEDRVIDPQTEEVQELIAFSQV